MFEITPRRKRLARVTLTDDISNMDVSRATVPAAPPSTLGLEEHLPTTAQRYGALAVCAILLTATLWAAEYGLKIGPEIKPFIPMTATIWALADLLTGFLLLAQFYVNGRPLFGILAGGYAFSGILTLPYLLYFPGLFLTTPLSVAQQQISICLWSVWHCSFPTIVIFASVGDSRLKRIVARGHVRIASLGIVIVPLLAASGIAALAYTFRAMLPHFVIAGHFQALYRETAIPLVIALNVIACATLLLRGERLTALLLWLAVAMFASTLDALLNLSAARFSYAWDIGKLITVVTASVVLVMILCDIVELYGRLARLARIDVLTSLQNRRAFEEHFGLVLGNARRSRSSMALLVIDIDFFKRFNDSYGHLAGDECLQHVAAEMVRCATRPLDLVTRYGGEEFVVILPETPLHGVLTTAERIRSSIEQLEIVHGDKNLGEVTVSIGVSFTPDSQKIDEKAMFRIADRALYEAKNRGRNRVVLGGAAATTSSVEGSVQAA